MMIILDRISILFNIIYHDRNVALDRDRGSYRGSPQSTRLRPKRQSSLDSWKR